jgi:alpha-beta hydrolase superfamily lysophospholipase
MTRMFPEDFHFIGCDGKVIAGTHWHSEGQPRAVVQIAHGMGEHIGRYAEAATFLSRHGIAVLGNDHRGHGRTGLATGEMGKFGDVGFDGLVADMARLLEIGRATYPGLPIILLAHSMGSFAAQQLVLTQSDKLTGLILSGTGALDSLFDALEKLHFDEAKLTNGSFEPVRTTHDWLSRDASAVDAFLADPLCFATLDQDAALSVARAAPLLADPGALGAIRPDLPVYCIAGSLDPIGQETAGVKLLMRRYAEAGVRDVQCDIYEGGRHEMLNETNRAEVFAKLLDWIERQL